MIPMSDMGPGRFESSAYTPTPAAAGADGGPDREPLSSSDAYSTLDQRGRRNTLDDTLTPVDGDGVEVKAAHTHAVAVAVPGARS